MWKLAELLEANVEQLALLESLDNGMPLRMAKFAGRENGRMGIEAYTK
jgi:acyl-CoA reductase-like NAD-dependent aldehyde dehydrogenase